MSAFQIRPATIDDAETIARFNCRIAEETEGKQLDWETILAGVAAAVSEPNRGRYLVACDADRLIGQLMHTWEWSDWRNGNVWWLQSVYVDPDYRNRGVFRLLYEHLRGLAATDPGVVGLRLYVERENERALDVYRRLGMDDAGYLVMEEMFSHE